MSRADPISPSEAARALIERQLAVLTRLADIGMEIAEAAGRRATAAADGDALGPVPDPGLTYARAARAVRLTIALQSRLLGDLAALDRGDAQARAVEADRRRERIHRQVERMIEAAVEASEGGERDDDEAAVERLCADAWERLTEADDDDLSGCPLSEVVARICEGLGLPPAVCAAAAEPFLAEPLRPPSRSASHPAHPREGGDPGFLPLADPDGPGPPERNDERCERGP